MANSAFLYLCTTAFPEAAHARKTIQQYYEANFTSAVHAGGLSDDPLFYYSLDHSAVALWSLKTLIPIGIREVMTT